MGYAYETLIDQSETSELLTTGEVAELLGVSRQHVVDLCKRGDLPFVYVGSHRKIARADAERARQGGTRITRDQRRSLWLSYAVAGEIVKDPQRAIRLARSGIERMQKDRRTEKWVDEWRALLQRPVEEVLDALTSRSLRSRELRQNSPFTGVLSEGERTRVLEAFNRTSGK